MFTVYMMIPVYTWCTMLDCETEVFYWCVVHSEISLYLKKSNSSSWNFSESTGKSNSVFLTEIRVWRLLCIEVHCFWASVKHQIWRRRKFLCIWTSRICVLQVVVLRWHVFDRTLKSNSYITSSRRELNIAFAEK